MSYGNFSAQVTARGAIEVKRSKENNNTSFQYKDQKWQCTFKNQIPMTADLADGCEMDYCLKEYCEKAIPPSEAT